MKEKNQIPFIERTDPGIEHLGDWFLSFYQPFRYFYPIFISKFGCDLNFSLTRFYPEF